MMDGEVASSDVKFPNWDNVVIDEDSHGCNATWDWVFTHQGTIDNNVKVNQLKRDITF